MELVVLGANGRTGAHVVRQALGEGVSVTAVVRDLHKVPPLDHENLNVCVGDPCDREWLAQVFQGKDAVISTLGGRSPTRRATSIYYRSALAIEDAAAITGVGKIAVTSSALLFPPRGLGDHILRFVVPHVVRSAERMEQTLSASQLNVTIARCGFLTDKPQTDYRSCEGELPAHGSSIARQSLARFLLDCVYQPTQGFRVFGVSAPRSETEPAPKHR